MRSAKAWGMPLELVETHSWLELFRSMERNVGAIVVVDPYFAGDLETAKLRVACAVAEKSNVIAYADFAGRAVGQDIVKLVELGVTRIVTARVDDEATELGDLLMGVNRNWTNVTLRRKLRRVLDL